MNWISTLFISMFTSNALLTWGFGLRTGFRSRSHNSALWFAELLVLDVFAFIVLWFLSSLVLDPLGLSHLVAFAYALIALPLLRLLARAILAFGETGDDARSSDLNELTASTLVFGISLIAVHRSSNLTEGILASVSAAFGWWSAVGILNAIGRRTEAGSLPSALRGGPAILLSAALLAMIIAFANTALGQGFGK